MAKRLLKCPLCGYLMGAESIWFHLEFDHHIPPPVGALDPNYGWVCPCGKVYKTSATRARHFRVHGKECMLTGLLGGAV